MAVAFADFERAIDVVGQRVGLNFAGPRAQTHGTAKLFYSAQLSQFVDHAMRRGGIKLTGVRFCKSDHVAGKLDASRLHPETDSKVRDFVLASISDRDQHALNATLTEAPGNQNSVVIFQLRFVTLVARLKALSFDPIELQLQVVRQRAMD